MSPGFSGVHWSSWRAALSQVLRDAGPRSIYYGAKARCGSPRMQLVVIKPTDMAKPDPRHFDGPLSGLLASMLEAPAEEVPGFDTISERGIVRRYAANCGLRSHPDPGTPGAFDPKAISNVG
jgi:hypothetical protein